MKLIDKPTKDNSKFKGAKFVVNELELNGHAAFIVGGAVRDLYMGIEPSEFDISTSATPKEIENIFKKTKPVGQSFGVILVIIDNLFFEVATFREDMNYIDGRHPEERRSCQVEFQQTRLSDFKHKSIITDIFQFLIKH